MIVILMKKPSLAAAIAAILISIIACWCWITYIYDSNLLVTTVLFAPFLGSLYLSLAKLRKKSFKASFVYSTINYLSAALVLYVALSAQ